MRWSAEEIERVLRERGWEHTRRPIQYGEQFRLVDGTCIDSYVSGKVVVRGKPTQLKQEAGEIFASRPAKDAAATAAAPTEGIADAPSSGPPSAGDDALPHVDAYTDGACIGNPGPGGYGVVLLYGAHRRELSGGYRRTTNNRMEILAAITALRALKERCAVSLYSDSQYLVKAMRDGGVRRWQASGWMRSKKERALNPDLWEEMLRLCERHQVEFLWVRGHAGEIENERCDRLAMQAASRQDLPADEGYESPREVSGLSHQERARD